MNNKGILVEELEVLIQVGDDSHTSSKPLVGRTNLSSFLTFYNSAVINVNYSVQKLLRGDTQMDRKLIRL
jgi:hypothetical protein